MKNLVAGILLFSAIFLIACGEENTESSFYVSPNESSELAVLMRDMFDDAARVKQQLANGEVARFQVDYKAILTAHATEPEKAASPEFKAFADSYLHIMEKMESATPVEIEAEFDNMIESCMNCHQVLCPGPIRKIENLY